MPSSFCIGWLPRLEIDDREAPKSETDRHAAWEVLCEEALVVRPAVAQNARHTHQRLPIDLLTADRAADPTHGEVDRYRADDVSPSKFCRSRTMYTGFAWDS